MKIRANKNRAAKITALFTLTYMISYITRINFGAVISEMVTATGFSKSSLSAALTGSFITYGTGQVISGFLGDKISPKRLIGLGFTVTVLMNLLVPLCTSPYAWCAVWCVNGFAQSFMWPPLVKLMTAMLTHEEYKTATARVSYGSSMGTIAVYLLSPFLISLAGWKSVFVFSAVCGILMLIIWSISLKDLKETDEAVADKTETTGKSRFISPLFLSIMLAIILQGMLRDGVTTWMPTYIAETYKIGNAVSIMTGVLLPLFGMLCIGAASRLYIKVFKNPMQCAAVFFALGAFSALALSLFTGKSAPLSVIFSALLTGCMHGVNLILICMLPPLFKGSGGVSTVSGILNACTYVGSAASTYGIAAVSEKFGWNVTVAVWLLIALCGTAVCTLCIKPWQRKTV